MIFLSLQEFFGVLPWKVLSFWIYRYLEVERGFATVEALIKMGIVILIMCWRLSLLA